MLPLRRNAVALTLTLALAGCGGTATPSPSPTATAPNLDSIACAREEPEDTGELTGAWRGDDRLVYYIRQVGDCVWWLGTDIADLDSGMTGQVGLANVASGRVDGIHVAVEWADLPAGEIVGGGGLTLLYDEQNDWLTITERRGTGVPYSATRLTRIEPSITPEVSPSTSPSP